MDDTPPDPTAAEQQAPSYTPIPDNDGLPAYLPPHLQPPVAQYTFYQLGRNTQVLEPRIGSLFKDLYTLEFRSTFSRKPDMTLIRSDIAPPPPATQHQHGENAAAATQSSPSSASPKAIVAQPVATVTFDMSTIVPYYPRATILQNSNPTAIPTSTSGNRRGSRTNSLGEEATRCGLEAHDMSRWTFPYAGISLAWEITADPPSFTLVEAHSRRGTPLARFTFSSLGTSAAKGEEIGELAVFRGPPLTGHLRDDGGEEDEGEMRKLIELLICGYTVAVTHHIKMGRKFRSNIRHATYRRVHDMGNAEMSRFRSASPAAWDNM